MWSTSSSRCQKPCIHCRYCIHWILHFLHFEYWIIVLKKRYCDEHQIEYDNLSWNSEDTMKNRPIGSEFLGRII